MTNQEKIIYEGMTCPCGGKALFPKYGIPTGAKAWPIFCPECRMDIYGATASEALTRYYVLTGGPVPGMIEPPRILYERELHYEDDPFVVHTTWSRSCIEVQDAWWLTATERKLDTIRTWLEKEWKA